jgi:HlyD family secretion protein
VKLRVAADTALRYADYVKAGLTGYGYVRATPQATWPPTLAVKLPPLAATAAPAASAAAASRP